MAAAGMAMKRDAYSDQERHDAAQEIVTRLLEKYPGRRCYCGGPSEYTVPVTDGDTVRCWRHRTYPSRPIIRRDGILPADMCNVTRLYYMALDVRRSVEHQRKVDATHEALNAGADLDGGQVVTDPADAARELIATPAGARRVALDMLADAGLRSVSPTLRTDMSAAYRRRNRMRVRLLRLVTGTPVRGNGADVVRHIAAVERAVWLVRIAEDGCKVKRPPVPLEDGLRVKDAPAFTLAYVQCRTAAGVMGDDIAEELALSPATLRKHCQRAAGRIAPHMIQPRVVNGKPRAPLPLVNGEKRSPDFMATANNRSRFACDLLPNKDRGRNSHTDGTTSEGLPESAFRRVNVGDTFPNVSEERATVTEGLTYLSHCRTRKAWTPQWVTHMDEWGNGHRRAAAGTVSQWASTLPDRSQSRLAARALQQRDRLAASDLVTLEARRPPMVDGQHPQPPTKWTPYAPPVVTDNPVTHRVTVPTVPTLRLVKAHLRNPVQPPQVQTTVPWCLAPSYRDKIK